MKKNYYAACLNRDVWGVGTTMQEASDEAFKNIAQFNLVAPKLKMNRRLNPSIELVKVSQFVADQFKYNGGLGMRDRHGGVGIGIDMVHNYYRSK